jgi:hypothetical protein
LLRCGIALAVPLPFLGVSSLNLAAPSGAAFFLSAKRAVSAGLQRFEMLKHRFDIIGQRFQHLRLIAFARVLGRVFADVLLDVLDIFLDVLDVLAEFFHVFLDALDILFNALRLLACWLTLNWIKIAR